MLRFPIEPGETHRKRAWLEAEADAARRLVGRVPFPTPEPPALGEPGHGYPLPWTVYRWLPGDDAGAVGVGDATEFARDLASFVTALRRMDARGRHHEGGGRGDC